MNLKSVIQSFLPGWQGKLAVHHVGYLGDGHVHRSVPYNALNPDIIFKKASLMQELGVDTVITTWQGPWATACHKDAMAWSALCKELGMTFALLLDPGGMQKWTAGLTPAQITANVVEALNDPGTQVMLHRNSYVPEMYVLDFNTGADLVSLTSSFPGLHFLPQSTGFSWPMIPWNQAGYVAMNSNPAMKIPGVCGYFNDAGMPLPKGIQSESEWAAQGSKRDYSQSVWGGPARILEHQSGEFLISQLYSIQKTSPYIAVVTWDDYDEQSTGPLEAWAAVLNGIDWV